MAWKSDSVDDICDLLRDTLDTAGAAGYVVGTSGGVDSALVAALCCRAVGPSRVLGLFLPSEVTPSQDSYDVAILAGSLSMRLETIPIGPIIDEYRNIPGFIETPYLIGNLMARTRMAVIYYVANRDSYLVSGTSNRTEFLLGYCTKFGDNAADIQPIIHLLKSDIWDLARSLRVPEVIVNRTPTAGLWPGQTDEQELGLSYTDIDTAVRALDLQNWHPSTEIEEKIVVRNRATLHKQLPAPSLHNQVKR